MKKTNLFVLFTVVILSLSPAVISYAMGTKNTDKKPDRNIIYAFPRVPSKIYAIDTSKDKIVREIPVMWNSDIFYSMSFLTSDGKLTAFLMQPYLFSYNKILTYDYKNDKASWRFLKRFPRMILPGLQNNLLTFYSPEPASRAESPISVYKGINSKDFFATLTFANNQHRIQAAIAGYDRTKIYIETSSMNSDKEMYQPNIYIFDINTKKIITEKNIGNLGGPVIYGAMADTAEGKLYLMPVIKPVEDYDDYMNNQQKYMNDELYILDDKDLHLIGKIRLSEPIASHIVYYPKQHKLYVQGRPDGLNDFHIDVIDTTQDKIIKTIVADGVRAIYRAGTDKLYIHLYYDPAKQMGFQVLDVNTDKITGFIPGEFDGLSEIPAEWMDGSN